jgi:hypothetical protein
VNMRAVRVIGSTFRALDGARHALLTRAGIPTRSSPILCASVSTSTRTLIPVNLNFKSAAPEKPAPLRKEDVRVVKRVDEIEKPETDKRQYRNIWLSNGLHALIVSDPSADMASAAMDVKVGHFHVRPPWCRVFKFKFLPS